jgi:hypothetical protein
VRIPVRVGRLNDVRTRRRHRAGRRARARRGGVVHAGLVLVLTLTMAGVWAYTSNAWDWLRRRE